MTPVFANSACVKAPERLILRAGRWRRRLLKVRYGLFVHPAVGPVLIDTGYTSHSITALGRSGWLRAYGYALAPKLNDGAQPEPFLKRFGFGPQDIAAVIVTHFHVDHISGLAAFPKARFIASQTGWSDLKRNNTFQNIRHGIFSELVPEDFGARLDLVEDCPLQPVAHLPDGYDLFADSSALAIPLPGHAAGHFGLLFPQSDTPLLYATDTQWVIDALPTAARPRLMPRLIAHDYPAMCRSTNQIEAFREAGGIVVLCHDDAPTPFDIEEGARP